MSLNGRERQILLRGDKARLVRRQEGRRQGDEPRRAGVEQTRLDPAVGKDHGERRGIGGHLPNMGGRHVGQRQRRDSPGLEIHELHHVRSDAEAIDGAGDHRFPHDGGDRRFGERIGTEQPRKVGCVDDAQRLGDQVAPRAGGDVAQLGLAPKFFEFLSLEHTNNNVHNVRLCLALAKSRAVPTHTLLTDFAAGHKVAAVLSYAHENAVEPFLEPSLGICAALLQRVVDERAVDAGRRGDAFASALDGIAPLLDVVHVLIECSSAGETEVASFAVPCPVR